jgi:hypothetical protein
LFSHVFPGPGDLFEGSGYPIDLPVVGVPGSRTPQPPWMGNSIGSWNLFDFSFIFDKKYLIIFV